jgi:hypothetical protein
MKVSVDLTARKYLKPRIGCRGKVALLRQIKTRRIAPAGF